MMARMTANSKLKTDDDDGSRSDCLISTQPAVAAERRTFLMRALIEGNDDDD